MTLIQLYRIGPTRYRIQKGFIVNASLAKDELTRLLRKQTIPFGRIHLDQSRESVLWIDTGMVWLHTAQAREKCFHRLHDSIQSLADTLKRNQVTLMANAIRTSGESAWDDFLCGDRHFLEIEDTVEKEVTSNLLRLHVPTLIAYSGRAGLEQYGAERVGSRRLFNSQEHYAARYLTSLTPIHLERVKQCLRRDDGVSRLDFLDINPLDDASLSESSIELRFLDGQVFLSTVRAQVILIQALFLSARRLVREGRRVGDPDQKFLERNRARAISKSMQARFEVEPDRREFQQKGREKQNRRIEKGFISAEATWLSLIESLRRELQILEVEYSEIAPLVLGTSLNQMGFAGLRNENDYFQSISKSQDWQNGKWLSQITKQITEPEAYRKSPLQSINETRHPLPSQLVRRWWTLALRYDPKRKRMRNPSNGSPPSPPERSFSSLHSAALNLANSLKKLEGTHTSTDLRVCLNVYEQATGKSDLDLGLADIPHEEAQFVRIIFRDLKSQFKIFDLNKGWKDQGAEKALNGARHHGISLLYFIVDQDKEAQANSVMTLLKETVPEKVNLFLLSYWKFKSKRDGKHLLKVEILLTKSLEK